ncbi:alpha-1,4-glucan synthase Mok14 [Schizosaccharomyces cryophilus OY26]|uniref:alpha-1,3-glucan synthase n=1 Tax=Schizosaccharomyces cryophilus (strain OY26 / ATCC MYA-4695 / CBS 11777 / NBRC 106824 / NRRL Y48691) TaxID=653667 RepID=S9X7P4_SCHCR|nr:alpha-1,4-glucan synthase Mok14 [Schizosaccharomyces cryophilus OY26]EPY49811.1 alpha-1,4-glucan synthase Mok14 [Schizosaccharomyces cryophilus OY26]
MFNSKCTYVLQSLFFFIGFSLAERITADQYGFDEITLTANPLEPLTEFNHSLMNLSGAAFEHGSLNYSTDLSSDTLWSSRFSTPLIETPEVKYPELNSSVVGEQFAEYFNSLDFEGKAALAALNALQHSYGSSHVRRFTPYELFGQSNWVEEATEINHVAWSIMFDNLGRYFLLELRGLRELTFAFYILFALLPIITGVSTVYIFKRRYYAVTFNQRGRSDKSVKQLENTSESDFNDSPKFAATLALPENDEPLIVREPPQERLSILFATLEYNIPDWNIKIKIGGLGVMAQLMSNNLKRYDLIWVVPCVGDIVYPVAETAPSIMVKIVNQNYEVKVYYHYLENIKYVILDCPIFRKQTSRDPYPLRMDDFSSAIFYSIWNQSIAAVMSYENPDIYHINDYHCALAPLYNLPKIVPCAVSLHNAEFQGLWPLQSARDLREVCGLFNLSKAVCKGYVQFGNAFNLMHAAASYVRKHQSGFGVVGVSDKYGHRSWVRYPVFWSLKKVGHLPNPDPTDIDPAMQSEVQELPDLVQYNEKRKTEKRKAQEWAGLIVDDTADLLVFVGRWSVQKGVDLVADLAPTLLEKYNTQLIVVGPVIDLYGKFAAEKFAYITERYPGRVFSRPEFVHLPSFIFDGADFALIPSRDEPFGLVAVEFGRRGAICIGACVGGLGEMPGWWYTVESSTTPHLLKQFETACSRALKSSPETRHSLRVAAVQQRFPVTEWVTLYDRLIKKCIKTNRKVFKSNSFSEQSGNTPAELPIIQIDDTDRVDMVDEPNIDSQEIPETTESPTPAPESNSLISDQLSPEKLDELMEDDNDSVSSSVISRPLSELTYISQSSMNFGTKLDERFIDANGVAITEFSAELSSLTPENSKSKLCIDHFLMNVLHKWYDEEHHYYKTGFRPRFYKYLRTRGKKPRELNDGSSENLTEGSFKEFDGPVKGVARNQLSTCQRVMYVKVFGWPMYAIFLALGQILSISSFHLTLLSGFETSHVASMYVVNAIFILSTFFWWGLYRNFASIHCLSIPFTIYGLAFTMTGISSMPFIQFTTRGWLSYGATWIYAIAASSGPLYFTLNFEDEHTKGLGSWVTRACILHGLQQLWTALLWLWGTVYSRLDWNYAILIKPLNHVLVAAAVWPIAFVLMMTTIMLYKGLPPFYRQTPGSIPAFTKSLFHRRVVVCFLLMVANQNFWMSTLIGRGWRFFWNSELTVLWKVVVMMFSFLVFLWVALLTLLGRLSNTHTWLIPVLGLGFGGIKWIHVFWGTSNIGFFLPWAGISGAYLGRALWLWLGVLDSIQGIGCGLILLQTLSRRHVTNTLLTGQVIGCSITLLASSVSPTKTGPGSVFPDITSYTPVDGLQPISNFPFWACLLLNVILCGAYLKCFHKENINRP